MIGAVLTTPQGAGPDSSTQMRWLVEVSRVGESNTSERYVIEANRWQSALLEARRLRGDQGGLPKLTIELMDDGYRAVDPALKVRYLIRQAPTDLPVTEGARVRTTSLPPASPSKKSSSPPGHGRSSRVRGNAAPLGSSNPRPPSGTPSFAPGTSSSASQPAPTPPPAVAMRDARMIAPPVVEPSAPSAPSETPTAQLPRAAVAPSTVVTIPADAVSAPPPAPVAEIEVTAPIAPIVTVAETTLPSEARPPSIPDISSSPLAAAPESPEPPAPPPTNGAAGATAAFEVFRSREEAPSNDNPIAYRELALATSQGLTREVAELLILNAFEEAKRTLPTAGGRYVQIALFDHRFEKRPERAPLATLSWKDWKGDPVVEFPAFTDLPMDVRAPLVPTPSTRPPGWDVGPSVAPAPILAVGVSRGAEAQTAPSIAPAPMIPVAAPVPRDLEAPAASDAAPESEPIALVVEARARVSDGAPAPVAAPAVAPAAAEPELVTEAQVAPAPAVVTDHAPQTGDRSTPVMETPRQQIVGAISTLPPSSFGTRRDPEEDLIGELFERLHELHFMPDLVSGASFVLKTLRDLLPCEGTLIHVFDIDRSEFAVVRAYGPNAAETLLFRTPGSDPLMSEVMRHNGALSIADVTADPRFANGAMARLGVSPRSVLCGAARQGGRYLGMIELANPSGGTPFQENEQSALEYLCAQFAELVANRPVVLEPEIVL
jgi:hypothetical protein